MAGGAAVFAKLLDAEKEQKILLDAGDWFQGTPEGSMTHGQAVADIFNYFKYDAVVVGNHEFDYGQNVLKNLIKKVDAPVLGSNVYGEDGKKRVDWLKPWIIKDVAGVKFGIFGLLTARMDRLVSDAHRKGLTFRREIDEAKDAVKALRRQGATVIIALTHIGLEDPGQGSFEGDQTLAASVEGIDLIVGGHSHSRPKELIRDATHGTVIVQAGSYLTQAGRVLLQLDPKTKKIVQSTWKLWDLWIDEIGSDSKTEKIVARHVDEVGKAMEEVVANVTTPLLHDRRKSVETALGSWMTDCERSWAKTDVAFQNPGGIRAGMVAGDLTLRDIFNIMPFDNTVVKLAMSGAQVRDILERGAGGRSMMQFSGMEVVMDSAKPAGERIVKASVAGKPLKDEDWYTVSTVDFLVGGGDGYTAFSAARKTEYTGKLLRDVLESCARKQKTISPPPQGRIQRVGG